MNSIERQNEDEVRQIIPTPEFDEFYFNQPISKLQTFNQRLDEKYGKQGTPERNKFNEESIAWFYGNMLKERRKELKLTQKQLAERLGREQSYIARVENGKADIQLSSFFRIASILGIQFVPTFLN